MALKVWLPLNGSLENKGISDPTIALVGTPTVNNSGKIGKCYTFSGSNGISVAQQILPSQTPAWSFACWFSLANTTTTTSTCFFSERTGANANGYSIFIYPKTSSMLVDDGTRWTVTPMTFSANTWYHLTVTRDSSGKKIYINGELKSSTTTIGNTTAVNANGCLVGLAQSGTALATGDQGFIGNLNDVRIYDHCLSQKEVKEISQGLVLHCKLDGWSGGAGENLLANSMPLNSLNGWSHAGTNWSTSIVDCDITSSGKCVRCTYTGTTKVSGGIHHPPIDWNSMEDGEVYTLSAYIRASKSCTITFKNEMMSSASSGTFTPTVTQSWQRYEVSGPINKAATYHSNIMYVVTSEAEQNMWIEACMMKLEKGSTSTSWTLTSSEFGVDTTKVTDSSGYGYNGTITGTLTTQQNSYRYDVSTHFNGSSYITVSNPWKNESIVTEFTHTAWIKWDSNCPTSAGIHSIAGSNNFFRFSLGKSNKLWAYGLRSSLNGETTSAAGLGQYGSTTSLVNGQWYFISVTFKNGVCKCYCDGELVGTVDNSATYPALKSTIDNLYIGSYSAGGELAIGNVADSRMYCTALSAEDILDLYHTSANIDDQHNIHSFEFVEDDGNRVDEQGLVHSGLLSSDSDLIKLLYDKKLHIEPDGSVWAHIYHHNRPDLGSFSSTNDFANSVKIDDNRWFNATEIVNSFSSEWEFLIIYNFTQGGTVYKERWIQTKNPETAVFGDVDAADITRVTGGEYKTGTWGGLYKKNGSAYWVMNNGTNGNWWGATGSFSIYQGGIPGYGGSITTTGCNDLYIRIDRFSSTPTKASIGRGSVYIFNDFIEK